MKKHIVALVLCFSLLFSLCSSARAQVNSAWDEIPASLQQYCSGLAQEWFDQSAPTDELLIPSPSGDILYLYAKFLGGYMIVDITNDIVVESGFSDIFNDSNTEYIYNGPLEYYRVTGNSAEHLYTNLVVDISDMTDKTADSLQAAIPVIDASSPDLIFLPNQVLLDVPWYNYFTPDPNLGWCGPVAAAMWLMYMDNHFYNSSYVPSDLKTSDGIALCNAVKNLIEACYPSLTVIYQGSDHYHIRDGINLFSYLANVNCSVSSSGSWSSPTYYNSIAAGRPVIIGVSSSSPDYNENHWVTGFGIHTSSDVTGIMDFAIVNDGETGLKYLNPAYFYRMIY